MVGIKRLQLVGAMALFGSAGAIRLPSFLQEQIPMGADKLREQLPVDSDDNTLSQVDTEALQASIKSENLLARANELYKIAKFSEDEFNHPTRVIGSDGHLGTLSYIYSTIAGLGDYYTLSNQSFPAVMARVFEYRLLLDDKEPKSVTPMDLTPPTPGKPGKREAVRGDLFLVANHGCDASDYPATVTGGVAFVSRGVCPFGHKSELAGKVKAAAVIIYNNEPGEVHGTLGQPSPYHVPSFGISQEDSKSYLKRLQKGEAIDVSAYMDSEVNEITTNNVVAQTKAGDADNCVVLGGHSDSVTAGPGINDDGSGSLSLLEVATQLTKFSINNCVRFAWWAAEEEGLLGSDYYASSLSPEENQKIRLFMDYDMMASPNFAYQIYNATNDLHPTGSQELRDLYVDWYESHDLNYTFIPFDGRSDYDGFIRAGIPAGGIATGAEGVKTKAEQKLFGGHEGQWFDPCYHQLCDDVSNVNLTAWEINTKLIAHSVATYAKSFKGFPERTPAKIAGAYEQETKYHGSKLVM